MSALDELKKIKRMYGEETMKLCREYFSTILEDEGVLLSILTNSFSNNARVLAQDITKQNKEVDFVRFILGEHDKIKNPDAYRTKTKEPPFEVLKDAGYTLYEATNVEEVQKFKKYYAVGEELCTFAEQDRTKRCYCFWAVKDDLSCIHREDFTFPKREDEYSTSVLAIQFQKHGRCTVSIKSRYNHVVINPDATYSNNLDKIAPGLYESFKNLLEKRGHNLDKESVVPFELDGYTYAPDGKYYKFNICANNEMYCPGNVIVLYDRVERFENTERYILMDKFLLDLKEKTLIQHMPDNYAIDDPFTDGFRKIEKIERNKDKKTNETKLTIYVKDGEYPIHIVLDELNNIVEYENANLKEIDKGFLSGNNTLRKLIIPNVKKIGEQFLYTNTTLKEIDVSCAEEIASYFLFRNQNLTKLEAPNLKVTGASFLNANRRIETFDFPKLKKVGDDFLFYNDMLQSFNTPCLEEIGRCFIGYNRNLSFIDLPSAKKVGDGFLAQNIFMENINMPNLEEVGNNFLISNNNIKEISLPKLKHAGNLFLLSNTTIEKANFDELINVGDSFMRKCSKLEEFNAPKLESAGRLFLSESTKFSNYIENKPQKEITPKDITLLDRQSKVKATEIEEVDDLFKDLDDIDPDISNIYDIEER